VSFLERLQAPDSRTLAFTPLGLGEMDPEGAAKMWTQEAEWITLASDVAEQTRASFADLAELLPYGVLNYEIFTLVNDRALFVLEQALRDRFIEHYVREQHGVVPFRVAGVDHPETVGTFDDVRVARSTLSKCGKPRLAITPSSGTTKTIQFSDGLAGLLEWARALGLLYGQRSTIVENAIKNLRNDVAHPARRRLLWASAAAVTLRDLAEIINHLWGHPTPGGRLYPAPVARQTVALGWDPSGGSSVTLASNLADDVDYWGTYSHFALVMATWPAPTDLHDFDSRFETTAAPVDYVWGPGSREDALRFLSEHPPASDTAEMLDRRFMVRVEDGRVWLPMRPEIASRLPAPERTGHWHFIQADTPGAALLHVRSLSGAAGCTSRSTCPACNARNLDEGPWLAVVKRGGLDPAAGSLVPDFQLPSITRGRRHYPLH
jgi:hypothetical protein